MAEIKLNKTEQKKQKNLLGQLTKYLPTLQLKKQQLQVEVDGVRTGAEDIMKEMQKVCDSMSSWSALLSQPLPFAVSSLVKVKEVVTTSENIAGVEVPLFESISFSILDYSYLFTPVWLDRAVVEFKALITLREKYKIIKEKLALLEEELRQTNIKVNLFEKRMIPECKENIRKIKIFLGDQEIAAICNAKIAKDKLEKKDLPEAV
ncbi:MAG TPA: V-type ATP synthase subunit D [Spirochaetota bacterium]|nr:V-type ATP synthase subunit D [Spirochaetota bacterium]HPJ14258.1 V-type ATP synthase subunit D [Spirochaetota bacterium]HPM34258.1 V-type ATP synthase subunit D [Spirochaetota bacterium]HQO22449.1 V-type ATP synthase subunit D [Spirochaetota bacterium]HQQ22890.1 V-type ATP synthase subunit D [Spirochaetota bacterium]